MKAKKFLVSGIVQGVFFRKSTENFVRQNLPQLKGYVKNLPSGQVEAYAIGSENDLEKLNSFLQKGPTAAKVDSVEATDVGIIDSFDTFSIIRD